MAESGGGSKAGGAQAIDPVCGMTVIPGQAAGGSASHAGCTYWFCAPYCRQRFEASPEAYVTPAPVHVAAPTAPSSAQAYTCPMDPDVRRAAPGPCPRCGMALEPVSPGMAARTQYVCPMHPEIVRDEPGTCPICGMD